MSKRKAADYEFNPDTEIKISIVKPNGAIKKQKVKAESITQTGNCLFITPVECEGITGPVTWYTITHEPTGATLTKHNPNIKSLKQKARKFWRALPKPTREKYKQVEKDRLKHMYEILELTPDEAKLALREVRN